MTGLENAKERLLSGGYTCVLYNGEIAHTSMQRGVAPLVKWLTSGDDFNGYFAADKVVGKATAFLYVLLGVQAVYAHVISRAALQVLAQHGIGVEYGTVAEHIINRSGDGICPFEAAVLGVDDADVAYEMIRRKMAEMNIEI